MELEENYVFEIEFKMLWWWLFSHVFLGNTKNCGRICRHSKRKFIRYASRNKYYKSNKIAANDILITIMTLTIQLLEAIKYTFACKTLKLQKLKTYHKTFSKNDTHDIWNPPEKQFINKIKIIPITLHFIKCSDWLSQ